MFIEQFVAERGIENGLQIVEFLFFFELNISELPLNRKETGNTLETRGLTYSYTFYTYPKNALTDCKGTKQI